MTTRKRLREQLRKNNEAYEENFQMMLETVGTARHEKYVEREHMLNLRDIKLQKALGIYVPDTCGDKLCRDCDGCELLARLND